MGIDVSEAMWDWILNWGIWIATVSLVIVGLVGTIMPFLPGHLFILGAAFVPFFTLEDSGGVEVWGLVTLAVGIAVAQALEFFSGAMGTRWFGGTKWGAFGAFAGGLVGLFFLPFGLILGPLIGSFVCEWRFADQEVKPAAVSGVGSVVGTLTGMLINLIVGVLMVIVLVVDIFFW